MGFRWAGEIYITGRIKDVIKKGGKNIFAGDLSKFLTILTKYELPVDASSIYSLERWAFSSRLL